MEEQVTQQPTVSYHQSELNWLMNKLWELGWKGFSEEEVQRAINIRDKNNLTTNPQPMNNTGDKVNTPMPMPIPENHICFERGHAMYEQFVFHNHQSSWGSHKCSRCGYDEAWQYDFQYGNPMHKD